MAKANGRANADDYEEKLIGDSRDTASSPISIWKSIFKKKDPAIKVTMAVTKNDDIKFDSPKSMPKNTPSLDEQWREISKQSQQHLKEGKFGLYACDLFSLSEIDRKEKRYNDQIRKLMVSAYIHLSGTEEFASYQIVSDCFAKAKLSDPVLPPAVIRATKIVMKRLNMDLCSYKELFLHTIEPSLTPMHIYGINGSFEIIRLYLNDEPQKAEKKIESGARKYIATHLQLRR